MFDIVIPRECRDEERQAKAIYNVSLHQRNCDLAEENLHLKKLLRSHAIAWSKISEAHIEARTKRPEPDSARFPPEILLRILQFAMTSPHPIIDPLSRLSPENLSDLERGRGNQIAIHFLATCRAMYEEGRAYLWRQNQFVFTSPEALRRLGEVIPRFRHAIHHITMRVIAHYFDDTDRQYALEAEYHPDLKEDLRLRVHRRTPISPLAQGGFRCWAWSQIVDFLVALRAPYDPEHLNKMVSRPLLLPNLTSLRLDLVNFSTELIPMSGDELHDVASHEFGYLLNELQVTGLPSDDTGEKAYEELGGMLKDEGLYLVGSASFVAHEGHLQALSGSRWNARVVRAWEPTAEDFNWGQIDFNFNNSVGGLLHPGVGVLPAAPADENCPASICRAGTTLWKRVPAYQDSEERQWMEFARAGGYPLPTILFHC
ncbi:hypothetical protein NQ176_g266 [Zarea fungicola]|uniref:Uncharacterized protein n=1 Tax=Zarea fungicola TaxID=93591 RepID=A0ACC1NYQ4_9HYPO|nr:hypothetical protein NQ176_g266 [Lecanicillium fungicola]